MEKAYNRLGWSSKKIHGFTLQQQIDKLDYGMY